MKFKFISILFLMIANRSDGQEIFDFSIDVKYLDKSFEQIECQFSTHKIAISNSK